MRPTRWTVLLAAAVLAAALGYVLTRVAYLSLSPLPALAPAALAVAAAAAVITAREVRARLAGRPRTKPILPMAVARTAALAKASSLGGALAAGGYAGVLGHAITETDRLVAARRDSVVAGLSVLAAVGLVLAALLLERACRTPTVPGGPESRQP